MSKIVILGDDGVGKTTFIKKCSVNNVFVEGNDIVYLENSIDAIMLMYDVTCKKSRDSLQSWKQLYDNIPTIIVGTHGDKNIEFKDLIYNFKNKMVINNIVYDHMVISSENNYNLENLLTLLFNRLKKHKLSSKL
jgi:GTPase SAR1 family protein